VVEKWWKSGGPAACARPSTTISPKSVSALICNLLAPSHSSASRAGRIQSLRAFRQARVCIMGIWDGANTGRTLKVFTHVPNTGLAECAERLNS
jgi:hypothetical protein